ncbi:hypothetical protein OESDEN_07484, partial [Oesophagostomum dentatum]
MLASEGFVVLCVAFFQYKTLVETLEEVEIEYFKGPIEWLKRQPFTNDRLGIQGVSFGGTIVTLLATRYPQGPIEWLKRQPFTNDRLGIQGVSFGGTIVTLLATRYPQ